MELRKSALSLVLKTHIFKPNEFSQPSSHPQHTRHPFPAATFQTLQYPNSMSRHQQSTFKKTIGLDTARLEPACPASRPPDERITDYVFCCGNSPRLSDSCELVPGGARPLCAGALPLGHVSSVGFDESVGKWWVCVGDVRMR